MAGPAFPPAMAKGVNPRDHGVSVPPAGEIEYRPVTAYLRGFDRVEAVRRTFGPKTAQILQSVKVEFFSSQWGYMGVSDQDGHLLVSAHYLRVPWMDEKELRRLARNVGLKVPRRGAKRR